ncbi:MAG: serine/threonine protein kinase, partial [Myxococcaceae bacterium]|nr:serine/threonine protein kinase [Myxococcaceae bacterium]
MRCSRCQKRLLAGAPCPLHPDVERVAAAPAPPLPRDLPEGLVAVAALGAGGMGQVFAVRDRHGDRFALKLSQSDLGGEAAALKALGAPHTPQLYASGRWREGSWLLMEELHGQTLAQREAAGPVEPAEALAFVRRAAELLHVVHARGLSHRDVKPENLWLRTSGEVALLDFGLAGSHVADRAGTAHYMAPEQCIDASSAGPAADLYALGAVLFELVTGEPVFTGSAAELRDAHVRRVARPLSECGVRWPSLEPVLARLLAKEPAQRPSDAGQLLAELAAVSATDAAVAVAAAHRPKSAQARRAALLGVRTTEGLKVLLDVVRREGGLLASAEERRFVFAFP